MEIGYVADPARNRKIAEVVEILKKEIIARFHPESIILTGSFGRGEVTVTEDEGKLHFVSDCEVIVVPYRWFFNRRKVDEFQLSFYQSTGLRVGIWGLTLTFHLLLPFTNKYIKPTMNNYDLKYGSRVLYGNDYLRNIPSFVPEDIPLWEGVRLLFNRMVESLQYFSVEGSQRDMVFWADKILLACQDAVLLSVGKYHHSYRAKNQMFLELYPRYFRELGSPSCFPEMAEQATRRKLCGSTDNLDPVAHWFEVAGVCDSVFRHVMRKWLGVTFADYGDFRAKYVTALRSGNAILGNFLNLGRQIVLSRRLPPRRLICRTNVLWAHIVYSLIPLVYFGLVGRNDVNEEYLAHLRCSIPISNLAQRTGKGSPTEWAEIKEQVVSLWRQVCW